MPHLIRNTH